MKKILFTLMAVITTAISNAQTLVTPPSEGEPWHIAGGKFYTYFYDDWIDATPYLSQTMQVVIDGNDIYIQGLASAYMEEGWVKGTINGQTVTIPSGQFMGSDDDGDEYINGQDVNATSANDPAIDIVFAYDAQDGKLSLDPQVVILESGKANSIAETYAYWEGLVLTKSKPEAPKVVTLPEGITPLDYGFTGHDDYWNQDISRTALVAFDQDTVYVNAISEELPNAWIKGILKDGTVTFAANQYLGTYIYDYTLNNLYFSPSADITMQYDSTTGTLSCTKYTTADEIGIYDEVTNAVWKKVADKAATPATPAIIEIEIAFYSNILVSIPTVDTEGSPLAGSKLTYSFIVEDAQGQQSPLVFTASQYEGAFENDMTEIPCNFADEVGYFQVRNDQRLIYLMQGKETISTWKRLGLKTTYTSGGETRSSAIDWIDVQEALGISNTVLTPNSHAYYNLQGQKVTPNKPGLYIQNGRKVLKK